MARRQWEDIRDRQVPAVRAEVATMDPAKTPEVLEQKRKDAELIKTTAVNAYRHPCEASAGVTVDGVFFDLGPLRIDWSRLTPAGTPVTVRIVRGSASPAGEGEPRSQGDEGRCNARPLHAGCAAVVGHRRADAHGRGASAAPADVRGPGVGPIVAPSAGRLPRGGHHGHPHRGLPGGPDRRAGSHGRRASRYVCVKTQREEAKKKRTDGVQEGRRSRARRERGPGRRPAARRRTADHPRREAAGAQEGTDGRGNGT